MNINKDATLVAKFVQGETSFVANQDLRIEVAFDSTQLLTRRGILIACLKQEDNLSTILVRRGSDYWSLLHHTLLKQGFVPLLNAGNNQVFDKYQQRELPPGYKLNATDASALWKEWWTSTRSGSHNRVQIDVLLFTRNQWIAIRDITCKQGVFFIKTLGPEVVRQASDQVVWLNRIPRHSLEQASNQAQASKQAAASDRSHAYSSSAHRLATEAQIENNTETGRNAKAPEISHYSSVAQSEPTTSSVGQVKPAPDLRQVVRMQDGRLYVTTPLGEIVVEGDNLKFQLSSTQPATTTTWQQNSQSANSRRRDQMNFGIRDSSVSPMQNQPLHDSSQSVFIGF